MHGQCAERRVRGAERADARHDAAGSPVVIPQGSEELIGLVALAQLEKGAGSRLFGHREAREAPATFAERVEVGRGVADERLVLVAKRADLRERPAEEGERAQRFERLAGQP